MNIYLLFKAVLLVCATHNWGCQASSSSSNYDTYNCNLTCTCMSFSADKHKRNRHHQIQQAWHSDQCNGAWGCRDKNVRTRISFLIMRSGHEDFPSRTLSLLSTSNNYLYSLISQLTEVVGKSATSVVSAALFISLLWRRDAQVVTIFVGAVWNGILSKILKLVIRQPRPKKLLLMSESSVKDKPSDPGMPSSHAMSLSFIGTSFLLNFRQPLAIIFIALYTSLALIYRIKMNLHTKEQVLVGTFLGALHGVFWDVFMNGNFPSSTSSRSPIQIISEKFLDSNGLVPLRHCIIPFFIVIVGANERRLRRWVNSV